MFAVVPMPTCKGDEFECGAGMCILMEKVCDRHADCPNSEDEPVQKCGINECLVDNGGCTHLCVDTPTSFHCQCRPGYRLVDNYTCDGKFITESLMLPIIVKSFKNGEKVCFLKFLKDNKIPLSTKMFAEIPDMPIYVSDNLIPEVAAVY